MGYSTNPKGMNLGKGLGEEGCGDEAKTDRNSEERVINVYSIHV